MKKTDLAYAAGIIDGEGSIGIQRNNRTCCRRGYNLNLYVQVTSSDEWLCQWLRFAFGRWLSHSINKTGNPMFHWGLASNRASEMLSLILPFLHLKRPQAELAISYQNYKRKKRKNFTTDNEMVCEEAQRILMRSMNQGTNGSHKGIRKEPMASYMGINRQEFPDQSSEGEG